MSGFPIHLVSMLRMCGAATLPLPIPINNIFIGAQMLMPAVQGGIDSDNLLGALIAQSGSMVNLGPMQLPAIAAIKDMASGDIRGLIPHLTGLPIPAQGENSVRIGSGSAAAGLGMMQQLGLGSFGALSIGELVSVAGTVMGMVQNFTQLGGGSAIAQLNNLQGSPISPGTTVVGQTSGYSFTFANYFDTRVMVGDVVYPSIDNVANSVYIGSDSNFTFYLSELNEYYVMDDGSYIDETEAIVDDGYIVIDDYITFYPTLNLSASVITT